MSPEIRTKGKLVADVPDSTGLHVMLDGSPLYVDVSGIHVDNSRQKLTLNGPAIGGVRVIWLNQEGLGNTSISTRRIKGDEKDPPLEVALKEKPIRLTGVQTRWKDSTSLGDPRYGYYVKERSTWKNPKWDKPRGGK